MKEPITERQINYLTSIVFNHRPGTASEFKEFVAKLDADKFDRNVKKLTAREASILISSILEGRFKRTINLINGVMGK